ncbi:MAG: hypothetical protein IOB85_12605 [Methylobacterium sp.]|nr:hypothetical protein [Methylobacterium sp.]MCA3654820.1 hypothetical protein [Methylobacterium sp.]MCA3658805.1 hypothetical protein [Methylobacterium sp.]MCA3661633.1 hypothetical protein [Methylobacterium sp.]MCA3665664.1 hypothetical protein [Methylobacterium sp.]
MPGTLIDTCVLRELHLPRPYWKVRRAVDDLWFEDIRLSMVTFAILEGGVTELPQEFKQRRVRGWMREIRRKLGENLLGIDYETSVIWGHVLTSARRRRLKLPYHDSLIAATAKRHELVVMTRNIGFFAPFNIEVFNPWAENQDTSYDFGEEPAESFSQPGSTSAELSLPRDQAASSPESLDSQTEAA